jgi:hypothetical protein
MKYRITFLSGLAAGYVLGARAGRERYEQIRQLTRRVTDSPAAQQAAGAMQAQAAGLAKTATQKVTDQMQTRAPKLTNTAREKLGGRVPGLKPKDEAAPGRASNGSSAAGHQSTTGPSAPASGHPGS